jgi:hypothetical protein
MAKTSFTLMGNEADSFVVDSRATRAHIRASAPFLQ